MRWKLIVVVRACPHVVCANTLAACDLNSLISVNDTDCMCMYVNNMLTVMLILHYKVAHIRKITRGF